MRKKMRGQNNTKKSQGVVTHTKLLFYAAIFSFSTFLSPQVQTFFVKILHITYLVGVVTPGQLYYAVAMTLVT